jgi:hypothetical protein
MKILAVEAEMFPADRRTEMKLIVAFRDFANAPENCYFFFRQHRAVHKQFIRVALVATISSVRFTHSLTHSRKAIIV